MGQSGSVPELSPNSDNPRRCHPAFISDKSLSCYENGPSEKLAPISATHFEDSKDLLQKPANHRADDPHKPDDSARNSLPRSFRGFPLDYFLGQSTRSQQSARVRDLAKRLVEQAWMFDPVKYSQIAALHDCYDPLYGLTLEEYKWITARKPSAEGPTNEQLVVSDEPNESYGWKTDNAWNVEPPLNASTLHQVLEDFYGPGPVTTEHSPADDFDEDLEEESTAVTWVSLPAREAVPKEPNSAELDSHTFIDSGVYLDEHYIGTATTESFSETCSAGTEPSVAKANHSVSRPSFKVQLAPFREGFRAFFDERKDTAAETEAPYDLESFGEAHNDVVGDINASDDIDMDVEDYQGEVSAALIGKHLPDEQIGSTDDGLMEDLLAHISDWGGNSQSAAVMSDSSGLANGGQPNEAMMTSVAGPPLLNGLSNPATQTTAFSQTTRHFPFESSLENSMSIPQPMTCFRAPVANMYPRSETPIENPMAASPPFQLKPHESSDNSISTFSPNPLFETSTSHPFPPSPQLSKTPPQNPPITTTTPPSSTTTPFYTPPSIPSTPRPKPPKTITTTPSQPLTTPPPPQTSPLTPSPNPIFLTLTSPHTPTPAPKPRSTTNTNANTNTTPNRNPISIPKGKKPKTGSLRPRSVNVRASKGVRNVWGSPMLRRVDLGEGDGNCDGDGEGDEGREDLLGGKGERGGGKRKRGGGLIE